MGETVPFQRARVRRRPLKTSSPSTLSTAACALVGKVAIIDRVNPGAVAALNGVADQFIPHEAHRDVRANPPALALIATRRLPRIRRSNMIKMLQAKLADLATFGPADGYDAEDIAVLRRAYESHIRSEQTLIRVRRLQSILNLALVGA